MTEQKTAERTAVTLDLTAQPVHAPATVEERAPAGTATAGDAAAPRALADDSPLARILELKRLGITKEDLQDYLEMQRAYEAREAEKAYLRAMAAWKAGGVPTIPKNVHVFFQSAKGPVDYWHEDLADVVSCVLPLMASVGLSHSWRPKQEGRGDAMVITVETVVTHTAGHSERVTLFGAPDPSGGKNSIQAVKSTITYLERIGLLAIVGLAAKGHDNDGRGDPARAQYREPGADDDRGGRQCQVNDWCTIEDGHAGECRDVRGDSPSSARARGKPETRPPQARTDPHGADRPGVITEKQVGLLVVRLRDKGLDQGEFCHAFGVPALEDIPRNRMDEALKLIGQQR